MDYPSDGTAIPLSRLFRLAALESLNFLDQLSQYSFALDISEQAEESSSKEELLLLPYASRVHSIAMRIISRSSILSARIIAIDEPTAGMDRMGEEMAFINPRRVLCITNRKHPYIRSAPIRTI